jgi:hypothetical protein
LTELEPKAEEVKTAPVELEAETAVRLVIEAVSKNEDNLVEVEGEQAQAYERVKSVKNLAEALE